MTDKKMEDMSVEELHQLYSDMLATANDLGFKVPDELLTETEDAGELREVCAKLDEAIKTFRAGLDAGDDTGKSKEEPARPKKVNGGSKKVVAKKADPVVSGSTEKTAKPRVKPKAPKEKKPDTPASNEESTMAKTAKTTAKKAPAKKTAAKNVKKATAKKAVAAKPRTTYPEKAKIKVLKDENPCREGTGRFARVATIFKFNGKLVSDYLKAGGKAASLKYSEAQDWIKIV